MKQSIIFCVFIVLLFASCDKGVIYKHTEVLPSSEWNFDNLLSYEIEAPDTSQYYELVLNINHSAEFSFQNFYINIITEFPDSKKLEEVISLQLADKMGMWLGDCNSKSCVTELMLQNGFRFKEKGKHTIYFENYSREVLEGINSIELKLYSIDEM